jgi:hypothetical protein
MISLSSYRLADRNCAGGAKDGDKQEVTLHQCETTAKGSERRYDDELPQAWVHHLHHSPAALPGNSQSYRSATRPTSPVIRAKATVAAGTQGEKPTVQSPSKSPYKPSLKARNRVRKTTKRPSYSGTPARAPDAVQAGTPADAAARTRSAEAPLPHTKSLPLGA